ncbi:MAG: hypothetical protein M1132_00665 [Chloroflexi bacterium]|nr:hypothetical protein [Chloroflexota bacterium]
MRNPKDVLWPFNRALAVLLAFVTWVFFAILFALLDRYAGWPDKELRAPLLYAVIGLGLIPLALALLDFAASRRAVVDIRGFKFDFSHVDLGSVNVSARSFPLPDNIGITGAIVSDTSAMQIIQVLQQATANEVVLINIKDGHAWWVTRLLALSAGAVRAGSPKAMVFVGMKQNTDGSYLGWAEPAAILNAILDDKSEYRVTYERAVKITRQLALFGDPDVRPAGIVLHPSLSRYASRPEYVDLGEAALEQILLDLLAVNIPGVSPANGSLENPPDRLTIHRLSELCERCLYLDAVDLNAPAKDQLSAFLDSQAPYVALVRQGKYERLPKREVGERFLLHQMLAQPQQAERRGIRAK